MREGANIVLSLLLHESYTLLPAMQAGMAGVAGSDGWCVRKDSITVAETFWMLIDIPVHVAACYCLPPSQLLCCHT